MADLNLRDLFDGIDGVFGTNGNVCALQHFDIIIEITDAPKCAVRIKFFEVHDLRFFGNTEGLYFHDGLS